MIGDRDGNPKAIHDWADLAKPGVGVLYPDPEDLRRCPMEHQRHLRGGVPGLARGPGGEPDPAAVRDFLAKVQANVVNMDPSGRQSMANFERATGDAVVTYENELLLRGKDGQRRSRT